MAETVTFDTFRPGIDSVVEIGQTADSDGVLSEIALAFGYQGSDPTELLSFIAPNKKLQENIAFATETLSRLDVRHRLGKTGLTGAEIARQWGQQSGLQTAVFRPLIPDSSRRSKVKFAAGLLTDGTPNWMLRTAATLGQSGKDHIVKKAVLVHSGSTVTAEGNHGDEQAMPCKDFMRDYLMTRLSVTQSFDKLALVGTDATDGKAVMTVAAESVADLAENPETRLLVSAVAGNWIQKGVSFRRALREIIPTFDSNPARRQLWVVSDTLPLGITGQESSKTHQNPYSGLGTALRNMRYLEILAADVRPS